MAARIEINKGPLAGTVFALGEGEVWILGSDGSQSDIPIQDKALSPKHITITKNGEEYSITNLDQEKMVMVNSRPLKEPVVLKSGDTIILGSNVYSFILDDPNDEDFVVDFEIGEEKDTNVSGKPSDSKGSGGQGSQAMKDNGRDNEYTDKDKSLSEAFLKSASQTPNTEDQKIDIASLEQPNTQSEKNNMQENDSIDQNNEQKDPSEQESADAKNDATESKSETTDTVNETGEDKSADVDSASESGDVAPAESAENNADENKEENKPEKPAVLAPFNVQDLFRFDQGVFPAEEELTNKDISIDLSQNSRFLLKVIAGANIGAEFHLDIGKEYVLGNQADKSDIVFNDISVSHQHAALVVGNEGVVIKDLGSKNGVIVEGKRIDGESSVSANQVVALGTTLFLLIDRDAPAATIAASFSPEDYSLFGKPQDPAVIAQENADKEESIRKKVALPTGTFVLILLIGAVTVLFGVGLTSLFDVKHVVTIENVDASKDLEGVLKNYPSVRYTYNKNSGSLFLIGHVKNSADKSELLYKLDSLSFVRFVDDNVVDDEAVWQEMNIFLSKRSEFKGISMNSPEPGRFVLSGYVKTEDQAAVLVDYLNLHFNFLSLLENKVVVETTMMKIIEGRLIQSGFGNIQVSFINGELVLTGYVNNEEASKFKSIVQELNKVPGVRVVKNFAVLLPAEDGIINLNQRYPNRYRVTGYSRYGDVSINVVINGRILTRGDVIDGMIVTGIHPNSIFLEKEGLKYKIDYNK